MRRPRAGFTLVEMLVVLIIISVLLAMVAGGVVSAIKTAKIKRTQTLLITLGAAADRYQTNFLAYPPTDLRLVFRKTTLPNTTNLGIESLVACLSTQRKGGPFYQPPNEMSAYCNADGDSIASVPTKPYYKTGALLEYADAWGNPLVYVNSKDYGMAAQVVLAGGGKATWSVPVLSRTRTFPNPHTLVLISAGPDGALGTADDVKNY
jgi:prepilin-type N-terminal cleavage/methylation domain-containing protein